MWTFAGLLVVAGVCYAGFRKLNRLVYAIGVVFERAVNLGQVRNGNPPVTSKEDADLFH